MYSKQLLEDVNKIVNPAFVRAVDFDKLNEAQIQESNTGKTMKTLQVTADVINIINNALEKNNKKLLKSARSAMPRDEFFVSNETVELLEALENLIVNAEVSLSRRKS